MRVLLIIRSSSFGLMYLSQIKYSGDMNQIWIHTNPSILVINNHLLLIIIIHWTLFRNYFVSEKYTTVKVILLVIKQKYRSSDLFEMSWRMELRWCCSPKVTTWKKSSLHHSIPCSFYFVFVVWNLFKRAFYLWCHSC